MDRQTLITGIKRGAYRAMILALSMVWTWLFLAVFLWATLEPPPAP